MTLHDCGEEKYLNQTSVPHRSISSIKRGTDSGSQLRRANGETYIEFLNHSSEDQAQLRPSEVLANTIASSNSEGMKNFPVVIVGFRW